MTGAEADKPPFRSFDEKPRALYDLLFGVLEAQRWLAWLVEQGGPDLTVNAHLKVLSEAREFADAPSVEEAADVLIALVGALTHLGVSIEDFGAAVRDKVWVNSLRTWVRQADGTWQHEATVTDQSGALDG